MAAVNAQPVALGRPVEMVLAAVDGARKSGSGWSAKCRAHEDSRASLSISEGDDGKVLLFCHAGCDFASIVKALGLEEGDLFPPKDREGRRIVAEYAYTDETGAELSQAVRFEPKDFRQRHREKGGSWIWKLDGVRRVLYRLPELLEGVKAGATVYVVEGEKDVEAVRSLDLVATCNPMGAGKWRDEYSEALRGAPVVIIADKDKSGWDHAAAVEASLRGKAASVLVVEVPEGKDASDWIAAGATREDFVSDGGTLRAVSPAPGAAADSTVESNVAEEPVALTIPELLAKAFLPREMLLPPWLSSKSIALLYGPRGIGKSRFIHASGLSLSCGIEIIPGWRPARRARVLLIDGELPGVELQRRFASLVAGYGAEPGDYFRVVVADDLPHGLPSLTSPPGQKVVEDLLGDAEFLILDNVSTLLPSADENDSAAWQPAQDFLLHLRRRGVATCLLHHSNKMGAQRGTSKREDVVDSVLALKTPEDADESDGSRFTVVFEKHRGFYGKDALPFVAELDGAKWRRSAPEETRLAIVERLTKAGSSVRAIAEEMSIPKSTIHRLIARSKGSSK